MNRFVTFLLALLVATVTVSSACVAAPFDVIHFTLEPERGGSDKIHASFRDEERERRHDNSWSTGFLSGELVGLDTAGFRASGSRPLRFAIVREAGRMDCAGSGGQSHAFGDCKFTADPNFTQLLVTRGIGRPTREQAFGLMAVNARREVIDAVAAAHYPTPSIDDLMGLTALGVNGRYISDLAQAGYRPNAIHTLIEFKALGISPEWIGGFARAGYANMPPDDLVQLKALDITPDFIAGFDQIGYRHLPVNTLVQLKALGITPEFVRTKASAQRQLTVDELVQLKLFGRLR